MGRLQPGDTTDTGPREFCDRCHIAHSRYVITLGSGRKIHLCNHHYNKHKWALAAFEVKEVK